MTKRNKLLIVSIFMLICGWLGGGLGYGSSNLGSTLSGILFFGGIFLIIGGIIVFILAVNTDN
jgi:hypothetical protein